MTLKIAIASHIVLDSIEDMEGRTVESLGGPVCYSGLTAKKMRFDVMVATKVGRDFPMAAEQDLGQKGIIIKEHMHASAFNTTRFYIRQEKEGRRLSLKTKCAPLLKEEIEGIHTDCWMVSPVLDEVPTDVLEAIVKDRGARNFVMLDPQGYTRSVNQAGCISVIENVDLNSLLDLSGITAIKADTAEIAALTSGLYGIEAMKFLHHEKSVPLVICTEPFSIHLLHSDIHYWLDLQEFSKADSTGLGDILSAAFCCTYVKENDPLWAICFGAGAVKAALETQKEGLNKIPSESEIEIDASYYYNSIEYEKI
jgi:sugar/nucleoside kinase (ribokinase family)